MLCAVKAADAHQDRDPVPGGCGRTLARSLSCARGVCAAWTLDGVSLPPPKDGRPRLSLADDGDQAVLVVETEAGYSQEGEG